jgi:hypothetical protein
VNLADLFTYAALTDAVDKLPFMSTMLGDSGLFKETGLLGTRYFGVEYREGRLFLVPITDINDKPAEARRGRRNRIILECAHLPLSGVILPGELHSVMPFGQDQTGQQLNIQARVINDKLQELKNSVEATREWHRMGALKGQVLDANGEIYYDLFDVFGVEKKSITIDFASATTDVRGKIMEGKRHAEQRLFGAMVTRFRAYCGTTFMDKLASHETVKAAYANYQAAQDRLGGDVRKGFVYGDVEWIEYNCTVSGKKFVDDDKAHMFPVGQGIFTMNNGIANYNEALGTLGQPYYAKAKERDMNKGWDLEVQANPGAINLYPEAMVEFVIDT